MGHHLTPYNHLPGLSGPTGLGAAGLVGALARRGRSVRPLLHGWLGGPAQRAARHMPGEALPAPPPTLPAAEGVRDGRLARLEAVLLLAREPLGSRKLGKFAGLADGTEARTLVRRLNRLYDESGTAFRVEEVAGGFQLLTRPRFGVWLRRWHAAGAEARLSGPALETLAIVAYRQPVMRADIEAIRGVQCGEMLRQLMERELVKIVGRAPELGRPFLYGTTKHFLEAFGLASLEDLPRAQALRAGGGASPAAPVSPSDAPRVEKPDRPRRSTKTGREEPAVSTAISLEPLSTEVDDELRIRWAEVSGARPATAADEDELEEDDLEDEDDEEDDDEEEDDLEDEWEEVDDEEFDEDADDEEEWEEDEEEEEEEWEEEEEEEEEEWDDEEEEEEEEWEEEGE